MERATVRRRGGEERRREEEGHDRALYFLWKSFLLGVESGIGLQSIPRKTVRGDANRGEDQ